MAKTLTQEEHDRAAAAVAAVLDAPDQFDRSQVQFAERLQARLARYGLNTLTTYHQHARINEIARRVEQLRGNG